MKQFIWDYAPWLLLVIVVIMLGRYIIRLARFRKALMILDINGVDTYGKDAKELKVLVRQKYSDKIRLVSHRIVTCLKSLVPAKDDQKFIEYIQERLNKQEGRLGIANGKVIFCRDEALEPKLGTYYEEYKFDYVDDDILAELQDLIAIKRFI
jgi:hypothetical protein